MGMSQHQNSRPSLSGARVATMPMPTWGGNTNHGDGPHGDPKVRMTKTGQPRETSQKEAKATMTKAKATTAKAKAKARARARSHMDQRTMATMTKAKATTKARSQESQRTMAKRKKPQPVATRVATRRPQPVAKRVATSKPQPVATRKPQPRLLRRADKERVATSPETRTEKLPAMTKKAKENAKEKEKERRNANPGKTSRMLSSMRWPRNSRRTDSSAMKMPRTSPEVPTTSSSRLRSTRPETLVTSPVKMDLKDSWTPSPKPKSEQSELSLTPAQLYQCLDSFGLTDTTKLGFGLAIFN